MTHDRLGETAWRVVAARSPPLVGRLQDRRADRGELLSWAAALVDDRIKRGRQLARVFRGLHRPSDIGRKLAAVGFFFEELDAVLALGGGERFEIDEDRRAIVFAGLDGECAMFRGLDGEAHHGLVDRADLLDVESAIGKPFAGAASLALQRHQAFEDAQEAAVRDLEHPRLVGRHSAPLDEGKSVRIEQFAAARLNEMRAVPAVDEPKQSEQPTPTAAPLVHRVGMERCVLDQLGVEAAQRIALLVDVLGVRLVQGRQEVAVLCVEHEDEAHEHRQQALIEMMGLARRQLANERRIGRVEAAQQLMQRAEYLLSKRCRDRGLLLPASAQQGRQTGLRPIREQARPIEQQFEAGKQRPSGDRGEIDDRKAEPS